MKAKLFVGWIGIAILFAGYRNVMSQNESGNNDYQYVLIEAVKQKNLGNLPEAVKLYNLVIKERPGCDVAYYEAGSIYLMTNQLELARTNLQKAYMLDRDNKWYTMAYVNSLGALKAYDSITDILKEKIKNEPDEIEWEYQLATAYYSMGKTGRAVRVLENIEKERGFSEKITLLKASIYESEGKYELAKNEIDKVMILFPEAIRFRIVAAELCIKSGEEDKAATYYHQILDIDSTNIIALTNLTEYYRKKKDYGNSLKYLGKSFESKQVDVKKKLAILSYYLSEKEIVANYSDELDKILQVFLQNNPEEIQGRLLAADFYLDQKDYKEAFYQLKYYLDQTPGNYAMCMQAILLANAASLNEDLLQCTAKALTYYPDSADIRFFRAIGLFETEEYKLLIADLDSVSFENYSTKEYVSQSKMLYAEAMYRLGEYDTSDSLFESLIREEPENYMVLNNYSYYLAERGVKLDRAVKWSGITIRDNPKNATFLDTYAWVLYKMKRYEEAEKSILNALQYGGENDPEVNEHAGDIQVALRSYEIARSYYLKAIILGGDKEKLEQKIKTVQNIHHE